MNQRVVAPSGKIVIVVGLDLSRESEPLLEKARDLVAAAPHAEMHVVHVVGAEPLVERLSEPLGSEGIGTKARKESALWELVGLCRNVVEKSRIRWFVHVRAGRTADELARLARDVGADFVIVEAHDRAGVRRLFQRSVVAGIARKAPCSVLTVRGLPHNQRSASGARLQDTARAGH